MGVEKLEDKLKKLRELLHELETVEEEKIRQKRIAADIGDDFRENEGAKLVTEDQGLWYVRKLNLKREILNLKKQIIRKKRGE